MASPSNDTVCGTSMAGSVAPRTHESERLGNRFNRTAAAAPLFKYWAPSDSADERVESEVRLRQGYGGQHSRGLPTVAHACVGKRERRLVSRTGIEPGSAERPHT